MLVDFNEFPSFFQKVQHSHSRHQKTTSNLRIIKLKAKFSFNNSWPLEGATYVTLDGKIFGGHPKIFSFMPFSQICDGFRQNDSQGFE